MGGCYLCRCSFHRPLEQTPHHRRRLLPLSELPFDVEGEIVRLERSPLTIRLLEVGCLPGCRVRRYAQLAGGRRLVVEVNGMLIALRAEEARIVTVKIHESA